MSTATPARVVVRFPVHPWRGFWRMVFDVFSQRTVHRRDRAAGHAHTPIMYGFLLLLAATSIITVEYDISEPFFGFTFWHGDFYLAFSLIADLAGLGLIVGVVYMMWRRWQVRPPKLAYRRELSRGNGDPTHRPRLGVGRHAFPVGAAPDRGDRLPAGGRAARHGPTTVGAMVAGGLGARPDLPRARHGRGGRRSRAPGQLVDPRHRGAGLHRRHSLDEGEAHHCRAGLALHPRCAGPAPPPQARARPRGRRRRCGAGGRLRQHRSVSRGRTCSTSTPAPSAGAATRHAPPLPAAPRSVRAT